MYVLYLQYDLLTLVFIQLQWIWNLVVLYYIMKYGLLLECTNNYSITVDKEFGGRVLPLECTFHF